MNAVISSARRTLGECLVWDNHGCMPLRPEDEAFLPQLSRYRDAGVDVAVLNVGFDLYPLEHNIRVIATFRDWLSRQDDFTLISSVKDIEQARADGRLAVAFDLEGFAALGGQVSMVPLYYELGVRWMLIAYNHNNAAGGGCQDDDSGLTSFGRQVIDAMNRCGMVVCCSHTGYRTAFEVMDYASGPVILSHSNPRQLVDHPRNVPDELMRACAETGGVMGITGVGLFLGDAAASPQRIAEHIDYAVQLIGVDHVGLGFDHCFDQQEIDDFMRDHPELWPADMDYSTGMQIAGPEALEGVVEALDRLGYTGEQIAGVLGENFLRVAREVWT